MALKTELLVAQLFFSGWSERLSAYGLVELAMWVAC